MLVARQHGLIFNLDKCRIKQPRTFFGMLFNAEGVHPDPKKIEAIKAIQEPQDAQELQTFLGIATYMAPFIPNLSAMSEPLRNLLKKDTDFQWSSSHSTAFESIKQAICQEVSLTYFDPKKETVIQVDASMWGSGNALIQDGKAVAFASTALTDTKKREEEQSNGKVENAVKTCNGLLMKAQEDKKDPLLAIVEWCKRSHLASSRLYSAQCFHYNYGGS
ncbi:hypothetical protein ACROYT_G013661 [Oculina patagonica]